MQRGGSRDDARRGPRIAQVSSRAAAVIPAAGRGERALPGTLGHPKQFHPLAGRPLFMWSIDAAIAAGCAPVILVVPAAAEERARELVGDDAVLVVPGGPERQHSVGLGLEHVGTDFVVVHDAARPFATPELFARVLAAAREADAVIAGMPVDETIKRVQAGHAPARAVLETVDRSSLWRSQTPAAFRTGSLKEAHRRAQEEGFVGTDESQLIERYGGRVKVVMGARSNLKVTFPEDFRVAEAMMSARGK